ncbi:MAG: hypothetical protein D6718_05530 [Acidobacteria bacterium]|nr:MAG: hypothetical protein D6718_05530 [Acidobacteriota bacterium]
MSISIEGDPAVGERLGRVARRWAGDAVMRYRSAPPAYLWLYRSVLVQASADPAGGVRLSAILLLGPRTRGGLPRVRGGGRVRVDHEGDILLERDLPAEAARRDLDGEVQRFCREAHRLAELLYRRFGGKRAIDRFEEEVLGLLGIGAAPAPLPN